MPVRCNALVHQGQAAKGSDHGGTPSWVSGLTCAIQVLPSYLGIYPGPWGGGGDKRYVVFFFGGGG